MEFKKIGVVGAGVMGIGVSQNVAQYGMDVVLVDISEEILEKARTSIHNNVRLASMMSKEHKHDPDEILSRIQFTQDTGDLKDVDFLVENVVEIVDVKHKVYTEIDPIIQSDCVFAVNTSAVSIEKVGSWTSRPDKIVGMHFMNPVPMKKVVEVIRSTKTSDASLETALTFLSAMDKTGVVVNDKPGFVSNRVLMITVNESIRLVEDGVASAADVDKIFKGCFGHTMGPIETGDLIGLDTIKLTLDVLKEAYGDSKFEPCDLLREMVDSGRHGRKSGEGFYKYPTF